MKTTVPLPKDPKERVILNDGEAAVRDLTTAWKAMTLMGYGLVQAA